MSEIFVARFPSRSNAFAARKAFADLGRGSDLAPEDIEVVSRSRQDAIVVHPEVNMPIAQTIGGAIWGAAIGTVFLMPFVGMAVGGGVGFLTGRSADIGLRNTYLRQIGRDIGPGQAAVAVLARSANPAAVATVIRRFGGQVLRSSLSGKTEDQVHTLSSADPEKADLRDQPALA